jgi:hypothetical protein
MVMKANSHRYFPTFPIHLYKERYSALTAGCYFFTYPSEAKKTNYLRVDSTAMISHSKINAIPLLHIIVSRGSSNALRAKSDEGNERANCWLWRWRYSARARQFPTARSFLLDDGGNQVTGGCRPALGKLKYIYNYLMKLE